MSAWHVSRAVPIDRDTYMVVEGLDPWNRHAFTLGPLGDHARWWLKLQQKHQRQPWQPWRLEPPPITGIRIIKLTWLDWLLARLFVAWAIWRLARPW